MSVTCQGFGKLAGQNAARHALSGPAPEGERAAERAAEKLRGLITGADIPGVLPELQHCSDKALLILRCEEGLQNYLSILNGLETELGRGCRAEKLGSLLELRNLVTTGRMIASAALARRESRGSHYRSDYPAADDSLAHMLPFRREPDR